MPGECQKYTYERRMKMGSNEQLKIRIRMGLNMAKTMSEPAKSMLIAQLQGNAADAGLDWDEVTEGIDVD